MFNKRFQNFGYCWKQRDWSQIILDGPWARYLWYGNNLGRLPDGRDKPLPNRCIKNCCQRFAQIWGKIAQEIVWEAIWHWSLEDIYGSQAICNLYGINDEIRTVVVIKVS